MVICADRTYRTRANRAFCQRHGICLSGPRLGRPKSDPQLLAEEKHQFLDHQRQRNAVEGKIGQGKRRHGLEPCVECAHHEAPQAPGASLCPFSLLVTASSGP
jgi:hypothetical protein